MAAVALAASFVAGIGSTAAVAQSDTDWTLEYDGQANRFRVSKSDGSICDRFGEGAAMTDEGDGCWYAPDSLGFLLELGFDAQPDGFAVADRQDDVLVFQERRMPEQMRFDVRGLQWAQIDANEELLQGAAGADGAVVGETFDETAGPRVAFFAELSEPPIWDGDTLAFNTNTYTDDDIGNDMVRSLDPSFPNGGGDSNISAGWSYLDGDERITAVNVWSQDQQSILPGNIVAGPSQDPPGVWVIMGPELLGHRFNSVVVTKPLFAPMLIDRVEGASGPFASFELDGNTQAYFEGFTMSGTANVPGNDFEVVFHTPYAPLFEGGSANIGFLMGGQEQSFAKDVEATDTTVSVGLSLPVGETGLTSIELLPSKQAKVAVDGQKRPVALKKWLQGDQLAEINAAAREIMDLSMSSRFELADGQEISLGAGPR
jgi:hypothetical protein